MQVFRISKLCLSLFLSSQIQKRCIGTTNKHKLPKQTSHIGQAISTYTYTESQHVQLQQTNKKRLITRYVITIYVMHVITNLQSHTGQEISTYPLFLSASLWFDETLCLIRLLALCNITDDWALVSYPLTSMRWTHSKFHTRCPHLQHQSDKRTICTYAHTVRAYTRCACTNIPPHIHTCTRTGTHTHTHSQHTHWHGHSTQACHSPVLRRLLPRRGSINRSALIWKTSRKATA